MKHLYQVMPDLSSEEYAALKADIEASGVQVPVDGDEDDQTIDGFHRRQICEELGIECPKRVLIGLTEAQKREHAYRMNLMRRHLSKAQKREIAGKLRLEGWTQDAIAKDLDSSRPTVLRWIDQFMQMNKLPQPETIYGKDGKAYRPTKARWRVKRQTAGVNTTEHASMSPTPSEDSIGAHVDPGLVAEKLHQNAVHATAIKPESPLSGKIGGALAPADPSDAASPGSSTTSSADWESTASPMGSRLVSCVDNRVVPQ